MEIFITNLLFLSICMGLLVLLLKVTASLFKKRYQIKIRQVIWVLLAIRLIIPIPAAKSLFSFSNSDTYKDNEINYTLTRKTDGETIKTKLHIRNDTLYFLDSKPVTKNDGRLTVTYTPKTTSYRNYESTGFSEIIEDIQYKMVFSFLTFLDFIKKYKTIIFGLYITGVILYIFFHLAGLILYRKKLYSSLQKADENTIETLHKIATDIGLKKTPQIYFSAAIASPMVMGITKPVILMPVTKFTDKQLKLAITHELIHIKHQDLIIKHLYFLANAIHWFNPLIYAAVKEAQKDMELYCDYSVVASFEKEQRMEYNELLMTILEFSARHTKQPFFSTCMRGNSNEFKERFIQNLDSDRKNIGYIPCVISAVLILFFSLLFSINTNTIASDNVDVSDKIADTHVYSDFNFLPDLFESNNGITDDFDSEYNNLNETTYSGNLEDMLNARNYYEQTYYMGDPQLNVKTFTRKDGAYMLPVHNEDWEGNVIISWQKAENKGKTVTKAPDVRIFIDDTEIHDYGVVCQDGTYDYSNNPAGSEFFAEQCKKGVENPCFKVTTWDNIFPDGTVRIVFPKDTIPDAVDVEDVVLNEDGLPRYPEYPCEIVYKGASINSDFGIVSFALREHSSISLYENNWVTYDELVHPYYRGFRITCHFAGEKEVKTYTYYIVCRTITTAYDKPDAIYSDMEGGQQ